MKHIDTIKSTTMAFSTSITMFVCLCFCFCLAQLTMAQLYQHEIESSEKKSPLDWFNLERIIYLPTEYESSSLDESDLSDVHIRAKRSYQSTQHYPVKGDPYLHYAEHGKSNNLNQKLIYQPQYHHQPQLHQVVKYCQTLSRTATDEWCTENCRQGYCPQTHCICSKTVYGTGNTVIGSSIGHNNGHYHQNGYGSDSSYQHTINSNSKYPSYHQTTVYKQYPLYGNGYKYGNHQTKNTGYNTNYEGEQFEQQKELDLQ